MQLRIRSHLNLKIDSLVGEPLDLIPCPGNKVNSGMNVWRLTGIIVGVNSFPRRYYSFRRRERTVAPLVGVRLCPPLYERKVIEIFEIPLVKYIFYHPALELRHDLLSVTSVDDFESDSNNSFVAIWSCLLCCFGWFVHVISLPADRLLTRGTWGPHAGCRVLCPHRFRQVNNLQRRTAVENEKRSHAHEIGCIR